MENGVVMTNHDT